MAASDVRPAEVITLVLPGERAHPAVAEILAELAAGRDISVLDLAFVVRTADEAVRTAGIRAELDQVGLGHVGSLELSAQALISDDDLSVIRDSLEPGTSAAVIAYEHSWARRLATAVRDAGGTVFLSRHAGQPADQQQAQGASREQQAVAESEAAVRAAEAEAAAAERAAGRYATLGSPPATGGDDLPSQLAYLARLRESGALSEAEFEAAKARMLTT
jgi:Family of unknown function (DUF6325)